MSCKVNKGPHTFYSTLADRVDPPRVGPREEYTIVTWHTCLGCGVRRAITTWGELLVKIKGEWQERKAEDE